MAEGDNQSGVRPLWIALAAVALVVVIGGAAFTFLGGSEASAYRLDLSLTEPSGANRSVPGQVQCPSGGRGDGPLPGADYVDVGEGQVNAVVAPGQLIAFHFLVEVAEDAPDGGELDFTATWDHGEDDTGGLDDAIGVECAFVDTDDTATVDDESRPASVRWTPFAASDGQIQASYALQGLDAGDSVVIETWLVVRDAVVERPAALEFTVSDIVSETKTELVQDSVTFRLANFDRFEQVDLGLDIDDSEVEGPERSQRVVYVLAVTNPSGVTVANNVLLATALDGPLTVSDIVVSDDEGAVTTCQEVETGLTCDLGFVNPLETVTIRAEATVGPNAEVRWAKEDGDCENGQQDLCARAAATWERGPGQTGDLTVDEPTDIPTDSVISISKTVPSSFIGPDNVPVAYPGEEVPFTYIVVNAADSPLSQVDVQDTGCDPVALTRGDTNSNARLDEDETWFFECTVAEIDEPVSQTSVEAFTADGQRVESSTVTELRLVTPTITLESASSTDAATAIFEVSAAGNDLLRDVIVNSPNCGDVELIDGDADDDGLLSEEETWTFSCPIRDPAESVTARAYATDSLGSAVTSEATTSR